MVFFRSSAFFLFFTQAGNLETHLLICIECVKNIYHMNDC